MFVVNCFCALSVSIPVLLSNIANYTRLQRIGNRWNNTLQLRTGTTCPCCRVCKLCYTGHINQQGADMSFEDINEMIDHELEEMIALCEEQELYNTQESEFDYAF